MGFLGPDVRCLSTLVYRIIEHHGSSRPGPSRRSSWSPGGLKSFAVKDHECASGGWLHCLRLALWAFQLNMEERGQFGISSFFAAKTIEVGGFGKSSRIMKITSVVFLSNSKIVPDPLCISLGRLGRGGPKEDAAQRREVRVGAFFTQLTPRLLSFAPSPNSAKKKSFS